MLQSKFALTDEFINSDRFSLKVFEILRLGISFHEILTVRPPIGLDVSFSQILSKFCNFLF